MFTLGDTKEFLRYLQAKGLMGIDAMVQFLSNIQYPSRLRYVRLDTGPNHLDPETAGLAFRFLDKLGGRGIEFVIALPHRTPEGALITTKDMAEKEYQRLLGCGLCWYRDYFLTLNEPWSNEGLTPEQTKQLLLWYYEIARVGTDSIILPIPPTDGPTKYKPFYAPKHLENYPVDIHLYYRHKCPPGMAKWFQRGLEIVKEQQARGVKVHCSECNAFIYNDAGEIIWNVGKNKTTVALIAAVVGQVSEAIGCPCFHMLVGHSINSFSLFSSDEDTGVNYKNALHELFLHGPDTCLEVLGVEYKEDTSKIIPSDEMIKESEVE